MNITNISAKSESMKPQSNQSEFSFMEIGTKGQIVEGMISKVSKEISIDFSGKEIAVSKSAVQNAKEGEIRKFEIMDVSDKRIVLKEVGSSTAGSNSKGIVCTKVGTDQTTFTEYLEKSLGENEDKTQEDKDALEDVSSRICKEDIQGLIKEGFTFEEFNLERFERALTRIKEQRIRKQQGIQGNIEKREEFQKDIELIAIHNISNSPNANKLAEKLVESNLPVTSANIIKLSNTMQLVGAVNSMSDKSKAYLIDNELAPTIENIYKAQYSGSLNQQRNLEQPISNEAWEEIKPQVEEVLKQAGMEVNSGSMEDAKWLVDQGLPISKETISYQDMLNRIKEMSQDDIMDQMLQAMKKGISPEKQELLPDYSDTIEKAISDFSSISDEIVERVEDSEFISLAQLKQRMKQTQLNLGSNEGSNNDNIDKTNLVTDNKELAQISAKLKLEEIRLKLTVESGQRLIGKGIHLETDSLTKIVEALREQENSYYQNLLKEHNVPETIDSINLLRQTDQTVQALKYVPSFVLGNTLEQKQSQTLNSLYEQGSSLKVQLDKANQTYDALMTAPRKDLGDSIEKAFGNVDNILQDMNLETTEANRRAVRILAYNRTPITEEEIFNVKEYDAKVNQVLKQLHPAVAVEMIREGINPTNVPIDELNEKILQMKETMGITDEEKYSKYLFSLERQQGITEEERKSFIGIYRLLNNVEKTKGAAVGHVLQNGQEMTLNNLLTAVRTLKSSGINTRVDDSFGELESLSFSKETITDQINTSFNHGEYYNQIVDELIDEVTPKNLKAVAKDNINELLQMSIEQLNEQIAKVNANTNGDTMYEEQLLLKIRSLPDQSEQSIKLLNEYQIPFNISNLVSAKDFLNDDKNYYKEFKKRISSLDSSKQKEVMKQLEEFEEAIDKPEQLHEIYDKLEGTVQDILNNSYGAKSITSNELIELKQFGKGFELRQTLSNKACYDLPIFVEGELTNVKLTIVSGTREVGKVSVHVNTRNLGEVDVQLSVKENGLTGYLLSDNRNGLEALKDSSNSLRNSFKEIGIEVKQLHYGYEQTVSFLIPKTNNEAELEDKKIDTEQLYQAAKVIIQNIKQADIESER